MPVPNTKTARTLAVLLALSAGFLVYWSLRAPEAGKQQASLPGKTPRSQPPLTREGDPSPDSSGVPSTVMPASTPGSTPSPRPDSSAPANVRTKVADRGVPRDRSKLPVVDLMKSAEETSPWPDGPRIFAEISSETKRFINLRPNHVGIMPTVNIGTHESIAIRLDFPENSAGDRIYLELVDGGVFLNTDKPGQILALDQSKKLEFSISSDERVGQSKLLLRQGGHTRVIPFWVGPLMPLAQSTAN